ncbi:NUDIX hydrolase 15, mitochondrial, partial [Tanacetum coccineum]
MSASTNNNISNISLAVLAQQLRLYKPTPGLDDNDNDNDNLEKHSLKRAAVLICLFKGDNNDGLRVILTKRSSTLSSHSGEVSLPGGKMDEGDVDDADTATREAKEEIGLDPSLVNVVTILEPFVSKHLLRVVPVIGILSDRNLFNPVPNVGEVDDVFDA